MLIDRDKLKENIANQLDGFNTTVIARSSVKECIRQIAKVIKEQPSEFEWKKVEDELPVPTDYDPDFSRDIIVQDKEGYFYIAAYWYNHGDGFEDAAGNYIDDVVKWTYFPYPKNEELETDEDKEFNEVIDRAVFECIWNRYFGDGIGREEDYKNDIFECRVYCWNEEVWNNEYHFWHKPTGYKLRWYKYPLRGAEANMDLSPRQFLEILVDCTNSIYKDQNLKVEDKTVGKWWEEK